MSVLEFLAEVIKAVAWPIAVVISVLLLREPLGSLIPFLTKLKYGDVELEFNKGINELSEKVSKELPESPSVPETEELRERSLELIPVSPKGAIIEIWRAIESKLIDVARNSNVIIDETSIRKPLKLGENLLKHGLIDESQYSIIQDLRILRNEAKHYQKGVITSEDALSYLNSAIRLLTTLEISNKDAK